MYFMGICHHSVSFLCLLLVPFLILLYVSAVLPHMFYLFTVYELQLIKGLEQDAYHCR